MKDINEMTLEELEELLAAVQAKIDEQTQPAEEVREGEEAAADEQPAEGEAEVTVDQELVEQLPDAIEALEEIVAQVEGRKAALKADAAKRIALIEKIKRNESGKVVRTFAGEEVKKMIVNGTPEYRSAWLRNLQGKPVDAEERTALAGGNYAIPQETLNKIVGKAELYPLLNAVDVMHIPGTVEIPVEGTINNAAVVAMGTAANDSADTLTHVSLGAYKLIKTIEITADVEAMAIDAFETWLVERLANKLYRLVTTKIAAGTGSSEPTGLTSVTATGNTYTKTGITYDDVLAIIAKLPTEYLPNAKFVVSRATFWQNLLAIKDTSEMPIVVADRQAPAKYNVLGFEVILEDEIGTDIVFGDLKEGYVWNFSKDISVDRDESVGFRSGSVVFRGLALGDGKPTGVGLVRFTKAS